MAVECNAHWGALFARGAATMRSIIVDQGVEEGRKGII